MVATSLDHVGDRWALLIVRDLLSGPKRFTDLSDRLGGITPKMLTQRLRELESNGLVVADRQTGRRQVWYSLTPVGADLAPVIEELVLWGLRHLASPPAPGEPSHPEHLLMALRIVLERQGIDVGTVQWVVHLADDVGYTIQGSARHWTVEQGTPARPDVTIATTREGLADFLTTPGWARTEDHPRVHLTGTRQAIKTFMDAIAAFPGIRPTSLM
jgi:DNA-binding HxlR family transcriptional regulator